MKRMHLAELALGLTLLSLAFGTRAQEAFDHFSTGFVLDGGHRAVTCESCHVGGTFDTTSPVCESCHSSGGLVRASSKPPNHVMTIGMCSDCHTTSSWTVVPFMDHTAVLGSCGSCHDGRSAAGKPPDHAPTGNQCDDCHNSTAWLPAVFDHAMVTGNCFGCHNGVEATGKGPAHLQATNVCEDCHSVNTWDPAFFVDHAQVLGACASCHNGSVATGKHPTHITSGDNCDDCHTTVAWLPANFDHANISGNCASCHNGTDATGKDPGHFVTTMECNTCHGTVAWVPDTYQHAGLAYEPLDHRGNLPCTDCHRANSEAVSWPFAAYQPDCAGCHAGDFEPGPHKKHENPDVRYSVGELRDCTGSCHVYTDSTMTVIKDNRPGPEHRISSGDF